MSYKYESSIKMLVNSKSHFPEKLMDELIDIYRKAEAFDALQEGLNKLIDEYDKKARAEFEHGFIGPATEALDIKKKIKNIVNHESEAD